MNNDLSNVSYKVRFKKVMERLKEACKNTDKEEVIKQWRETLKEVDSKFYLSKYRPEMRVLFLKYISSS